MPLLHQGLVSFLDLHHRVLIIATVIAKGSLIKITRMRPFESITSKIIILTIIPAFSMDKKVDFLRSFVLKL